MASAESITVNAQAYGTAIDGGQDYGWTIDGTFDALTTAADPVSGATTLYATKVRGLDFVHQLERRAVYEFALPAALTQPGVKITQALLNLRVAPNSSTKLVGSDLLFVFGYSGDGQVTLGDFANTSKLVWAIAESGLVAANVTDFVQSLTGNGGHAGFVVASGNWDTYYPIDANTTQLVIDYSTTAGPNTRATVDITSPAMFSQFAFGTPITFQATVVDPTNGVGNTLSWGSHVPGSTIGSGFSVTTSNLPAGPHIISATARNSSGQIIGRGLATITVTSDTFCPVRGNSTYEWINAISFGNWSNTSGNNGGYGDYVGTAPIELAIGSNNIALTPGFAASPHNVHWRVWIDFDRDNVLEDHEMVYYAVGPGTVGGNNLLLYPNTPIGTTRMRVLMDNDGPPRACGSPGGPVGGYLTGEIEDYTVNIRPAPPPPPPSYCASKGNSVVYEWIDKITLAGIIKPTGKNGGYGNFTAATPIALARGENAMTLHPGFGSGSYSELWRVWIDFNQDGVFADNESVFTGSSISNINTAITVPATATSGATRMRVSMKYGTYGAKLNPCEVFSYGEVEDYTVSIP